MTREIWKTRNRFFSILAIVAIGTGFFAGVKSSCPDMLLTAQTYFAQTYLADIHLVSTFGFNEDDLAALAGRKGVGEIMPTYSVDVFVHSPEKNENAVIKVHSLPPEGKGLNQPVVLEGRLPQSPGECVVEQTLHAPESFALGETVTLASGSEDKDITETLKRSQYQVVGIVQSPFYISLERGSSTIGDGAIDAFMMIPEENFDLEVYTDVFLTLKGTKALSPFVDEYEDVTEFWKEDLEALAKERSQARYDEIVDEAQEKIDEARQELADGIDTQQRELADAEQKIAEAQQELEDGKKEYADGKKEFKEEIAKAQQELADARQELEDGQREWDEGWAEYTDGKAKYLDGLAEFEKQRPQAEALLAQYRQQAQQLRQTIAQGEEQLAQAEGLCLAIEGILAGQLPPEAAAGADALMPGLEAMLTLYSSLDETDPAQAAQKALMAQQISSGVASMRDELAAQDAQLDLARDGLRQLEAGISEGEFQLFKAELDLADAEKQLEEAKEQLNDARQELADGWQELEDGEREFEEEKAKGEEELQEAAWEIADGEEKLAQARIDYQEGKEESDREIEDAKVKIEDAQRELDDLSLPKWYVWTRQNNPGYSSFEDDAAKVDAIAAVFPVFFIMVAALVCLTTMTRMVEEQRVQIGTLKALGYSKGAIMAKYLVYAVAASLLGSALGLSIGFRLFPLVIINTYRAMYVIPDPLVPFHWDTALWCTGAAVLCTGVSAFAACRRELAACPAQLMRPKAPKAGKRVLLEKLPFLWNRIRFIQKVTLRNVFRYKRRVFMTVVGIAGCTALMLTGFGLKYAIGAIVPKQYGEVFLYHGIAALDEVSQKEKEEAGQRLREKALVQSAALAMQKTMDVTGGGQVKSVNLFVPQNPYDLEPYIALRQRQTQEPLILEDRGVIINEKLAKLLGLAVGDEITITETNGRPAKAQVTGIAENYTLNYVYMTPNLYKELFRSPPEYNLYLFNMEDTSQESALSQELLKDDSILAVSYASDGNAKFKDMISSLNSIVWVLIASAGLLAFIVLYNLSNINVNERIRELATIKVLGFYDREVSAYIYRENNISTVLGIAAGLALGVVLEKFVIATAEVDIVMFAPDIPLWCFGMAAALTAVFTQIVNVLIHFKLKKVDMVECMKSVE